MGFLDTEEDKALAEAKKQAAIDRAEKAKKAALEAKVKAVEQDQNILAYDMGVSIKDREVFSRWIRKNKVSPTTKLILGMIVGALILGVGYTMALFAQGALKW